MNLEKVGEEIKRIVEPLDKGAELGAVIEEEDEVQVFPSMGIHSDWVTFSKRLRGGSGQKGQTGQIVKKATGKSEIGSIG